MTTGPASDIKPGRGFISLFEQSICFIRGRMLMTQFFGLIPVKTHVVEEHATAGSAKQSPVIKQTDE